MAPTETDGRARRGYVILTAIIVAAVLIFNIDAVYDLTSDPIDLVALLPDASGVRVGTPVYVAGVESGRVISIDFLAARRSAQVALTVRVDEDARAVIRRNSDVRAIRTRIIGQPIVQIEAGTAAAAPITTGDTLRAHARFDPQAVLERGKALPGAIDSLLTSARQVQALVQARSPALERLQGRLDAVLTGADALAADLEGGTLGQLVGPGGAFEQIGALEARLNELSTEIAASLDRYTGEEAGEAALPRALESLDARVAALQVDLRALSARLAEGGGILDRLARDSAIQVAIRGVQAQIDSLRQEAASIALRMVLP